MTSIEPGAPLGAARNYRDSFTGVPPLTRIVLFGLWTGHLLLSPFCFWASGLPQPADLFVVLLFGTLFFTCGIVVPGYLRKMLTQICAFAGWVLLVNVVWTIMLQETDLTVLLSPRSPLLYALFYIFNFIVCLVVGSLYGRLGNGLIRSTAGALFVSVFFQATALVFLPGAMERHSSRPAEARTTLFFNNPNQIAYYVILACSFIAMAASNGVLPRFLRRKWILIFIPAVYLELMSESMAGLGSIFVLIALSLRVKFRDLLLLGFALATLLFAFLSSDSSKPLYARLDRSGRSIVDELEYRGYDRMWTHPQYLLFGAGEGGYNRFYSVYSFGKKHIELHSSFGTVLFCYGIIGLALFVGPFIEIYRDDGWSLLIWFLPAMIFGLTHNGLRQSEFWAMLIIARCIEASRVRAPVVSPSISLASNHIS